MYSSHIKLSLSLCFCIPSNSCIFFLKQFTQFLSSLLKNISFCYQATSFLNCFKSCFCFSHTVLVISKFLFIEFEILVSILIFFVDKNTRFSQCFYVHGGLWFIFIFYLMVSFCNSFSFLV